MKIGQYAFWKFGPYPYYMGGEIIDIQINEVNGLIESKLAKIKGYEAHGFFMVKFITRQAVGKQLLADLQELAKWKAEELQILEKDFEDRLKRNIKDATTKNFY